LYKLKLDTTILSFLPILILIPLSISLFKNIHLGGIDLFSEFILSAFFPRINSNILITLLNRLSETIFIALTSWFISLVFGTICGLLSSDTTFEILKLPTLISKVIKIILIFIRSIHEVIWGLLLMQIYGINISVAIISICIPYIAINSKVINEQLENINPKIIESISNINGNNLSSLIILIWHPIINTLKNFGIYRLECALRSTTIIGLFGLGGIGTSIYLSFQSLSFRELWTYLWSLGFLIILFNVILKKLGSYFFNSKILITSLFCVLILIIFSLFYFFDFILKPLPEYYYSLNNSFSLNKNFISYDFFKLIYETILLSMTSSALAISLPPVCSLIFINRKGKTLIKGITFLFRLIPPPITILMFLMFNEPSISLAALSLGLYNASITHKLLTFNLDNIKMDQFIAINSMGVAKRIAWLYGLFIKQSKNYLVYCSYRTDILIRETAIIGIIGSVGLGWQLQESISSFALEEILIILLAYSSIVLVGEIINGKIKKNFI